jgi:F420-non-reducing hydrogenase iron-sulfur subunit
MTEMTFEPKIVGFLCNWCSYRAADLAGTARIKYEPNVRIIRVMCSGRIEPSFVLKAFALGADGVMIAGCHPGECHYLEQNYKTMRRYEMLRHTQWASAAEGAALAKAINDMVERVRRLGPLNWTKQWSEDSGRVEAVRRMTHEHAEALEVPA